MVQVEKTVGDQIKENVRSYAKDPVIFDNSSEEHDETNVRMDNRVAPDEVGDIVRGSLIGVKRHKFEEMYELYCQHAREVGFSVRKNTQRTNKVGEVVEKYYVCSNEGLRKTTTLGNSSNHNKRTVRKTNFTRTDCKAMLRVKKCSDDLFEVVEHIVDHNHVLSRKEWSHLHRSERRITSEKAVLIEDMITSGIKASDSYRYMAAEAGGEHLVGHTMKDHLNFANRLKRNGMKTDAVEVDNVQKRCNTSEKVVLIEDMAASRYRCMTTQVQGVENLVGYTMKDHIKLSNRMKMNAQEVEDSESLIDHLNFTNRMKIKAIEVADAQSLMDMLCQEGGEDKDFYYRFKLDDDDGLLSNFFWRDSMMGEDYQIYGDVVVFDTTYRTNKYNLICAPFVGLNNHKRNVMFGCAFISDEKTETFEWLFEAFKKSMKATCPVTIFTNEDLAITNAIAKVFPEARHMLCTWHLYENAVNLFGKLKGNKNFNDDFKKCLTGCVNKQEFEDCWASMIIVHDLKENSWFALLYELKDKWCTAFNKDFFSAEILSSQRSKSTNNAIRFKANKSTNLQEFYKIFKTTVQRWRSREQADDFECSRAIPSSRIALTGMLKHASEVYTIAVFHDFEDEFLNSISTTVNVVGEGEHLDVKVFDVQNHDGDTPYRVNFFSRESVITCTCRKFEEYGLFCCHCLRILDRNSVKQIPSSFIKRRWAKFAKKDLWDKADSRNRDADTIDFIPWRHKMARNYYNLAIKAQANESTRRIVEDGYEKMFVAVKALTSENLIEEKDGRK